MPLNTQILRDGKTLPLRWGGFHMAAMVIATALDAPDKSRLFKEDAVLPPTDDPAAPFPISPADSGIIGYGQIAATPLNSAAYTLTRDHYFVDQMDGEVLHLQKGDELHAWRS